MLKKILLAVMIAAPMCLFAQKFGYVNTQEVFSLMPEVKTADATLADVSKKYETEFKALQEEFQKKFTEFQNLAKDTPESIKERRQQELAELNQKIQNFEQMAGSDLQRQHQTLLAPIQEKIKSAIQAVGAENGFTFILDAAQPLYVGTDAVNVTPLVKTKLNLKDAPAATPAK